MKPCLNSEQIHQFVDAIQQMLAVYGSQQIPMDKDYTHGRQTPYTTAVVYQAFPEGTHVVSGFQIRKRFYGSNHLCLPELSNDTIHIQLYGQGSSLKTKEILSQLYRYGTLAFHVIVFHIDQTTWKLTKLEYVSYSNLRDDGVDLLKEIIYP